MTALRRLWRHHRTALVAFALAAGLTLFFAIRFTVFTIYWADPAHRDRAPEGWMTPGYVARSWDIPRDALQTALGLPPPQGHPPTLRQIARDRGQDLPDFLDALTRTLEDLKDRQ